MTKDVPGMMADSTPNVGGQSAVQKRKGRSKVTNHQDLLPNLDGRSSPARRFRDLVAAFVADQGGLDMCFEVKLGLLRRLAACTVRAEMLEARMMNGEPVNVAELCTLASTAAVRKATLRSMLAKAGLGLRFNEHIEGDGPTVFAHACKMGLEGIVSKRKGSTYRSGRSPDWLKMKNPAATAVRREAEEDWRRYRQRSARS